MLKFGTQFKITESLYAVLRVFLLFKGGNLAGTRHHSLASRMIVGSWLFTVLVFDYAFTGSIISMITTPKLHFIVHSIGDVVANKDIQPLIINESSTHTEFKVKLRNSYFKMIVKPHLHFQNLNILRFIINFYISYKRV